MDANGTILFIDSEGSDDYGKGANNRTNVTAMNLLIISLSSHVSFITNSNIGAASIRDLALFGELYSTMQRINQQDGKCENANKEQIFDKPSVNILIKDSKDIAFELDGVKFDEGNQIVGFSSQTTLTFTQKFWEKNKGAMQNSDQKINIDIIQSVWNQTEVYVAIE